VEGHPQTADEIRTQMRGIRRDLRADVKGVVDNANQILDWKSYVRSFPWASVAVAGVLGYLLVPRRRKVIAYDKQTLENYLQEHQLVAAVAPEAKPSPGILQGLVPILGGMALRFGVSYATKLGTDLLAGLGQDKGTTPSEHPLNGSTRAPKSAVRSFPRSPSYEHLN
jgi:hypothetical protein